MKVSLGTIEVSDHIRAALNHHYGEFGLASRERVRRFVLSNGLLALEQDVSYDYEQEQERERNA